MNTDDIEQTFRDVYAAGHKPLSSPEFFFRCRYDAERARTAYAAAFERHYRTEEGKRLTDWLRRRLGLPRILS